MIPVNIFYLHDDPLLAAQAHCDKHVVKMILETAQLLSTAHHVLDGATAAAGIYKKTHFNHPSAVWCRSSRAAYMWTLHLGVELLLEYRHRYGRMHKSTTPLCGPLLNPPKKISAGKFCPPPFCGPPEYKTDDVIESYRRYYVGDKARFAKWTRRNPPVWWCPGSV